MDEYSLKETEGGTGKLLYCGEEALGVYFRTPDLADHIVEMLNDELDSVVWKPAPLTPEEEAIRNLVMQERRELSA